LHYLNCALRICKRLHQQLVDVSIWNMRNDPQISESTLSWLQFQSHGSLAGVMSSEHCENFVIENIMKLTQNISYIITLTIWCTTRHMPRSKKNQQRADTAPSKNTNTKPLREPFTSCRVGALCILQVTHWSCLQSPLHWSPDLVTTFL
jgi:hypothetical protein